LAELKAIMVQWAEDKCIEQFLSEAEKDVASLDERQKVNIMERQTLRYTVQSLVIIFNIFVER
jgi:hypothetical protein